MATPIGLRKVMVFKNVPANEEKIVDNRGAYAYVEVTNNSASEVDFVVNEYIDQGHKGVGIPIPPNETRAIPLTIYKFRATGEVTVVAYGM